jgi:hypothetical protein
MFENKLFLSICIQYLRKVLIQYNPKQFLQLNSYGNIKNGKFDVDSKFVEKMGSKMLKASFRQKAMTNFVYFQI